MARLLVTADDVSTLFAGSGRVGQGLLPQLLRLLILGTTTQGSVGRLTFPAGDDVSRPGWDGHTSLTGQHPYVPTGEAGWELGTTNPPSTKATQDYRKRSAEPQGLLPAETAFVFVTPHRWSGGTTWAQERQAEGIWRSVRVLDATDLEAWLESAPAVARWLCRHLSRPIDGLLDADGAWLSRISTPFGAEVTESLVISGRDQQAADVRRWLAEPQGDLAIYGESREESLAFVLAAIRAAEPDRREYLESTFALVSDPHAFEHLASAASPVVVALERAEHLAELRTLHVNRLHAVLPLARADTRRRDVAHAITLDSLRRSSLEAELQKLGRSQERARRLARESKGSLGALLWSLGQPGLDGLAWADPATLRSLALLAPVGRWAASIELDRDVVAAITGRPYQDVGDLVHRCSGDGRPFERRGELWEWKARTYWWRLLAPRLDRGDIDRFRLETTRVLGEPDPLLDLSSEERRVAMFREQEPSVSHALRRGLVETVCLLSAETPEGTAFDGPAVAGHIVRDLLSGEGALKRWASLTHELPDLAEGAPPVFLDCLDELLRVDPSGLAALFADDRSDILFSTSRHTGILWALERIAWPREHLSRVLHCLGKLAELDPGGSCANRPAASLRTILLPWLPQTLATVPDRLLALDGLRARCPEVAWNLGLSLQPRYPDTGSPHQRPHWRDEWEVPDQPKVTYAEHDAFVNGLTERLISWAGTNPRRLESLGEHCAVTIRTIHPANQRLLDAICDAPHDGWSSEDRYRYWLAIHRLVHRHGRYPDADWAMPAFAVARLKELADRARPADPLLCHRILFTDHPEHLYMQPDVDYNEAERQVRSLRIGALKELLSIHALSRVAQWADEVDAPNTVGHTLAACELSFEQQQEWVQLTLGPESPLDAARTQAGLVFVRARASEDPGWADRMAAAVASASTDDVFVRFVIGLPPRAHTWALLERLRPRCRDAYWNQARLHWLDSADVLDAVKGLLSANRLYAAIGALSLHVRTARNHTSAAQEGVLAAARLVLDHTVDHSPLSESGAGGLSVSYTIDSLIDFCESVGIDEDTVRRWEFKWLPFILREKRSCRSLRACLAKQPELFVELLKMLYKRSDQADDTPGELSQERRSAMAGAAYSLLEAWCTPPAFLQRPRPEEGPDAVKGIPPAVAPTHGVVDAAALRSWVDSARRLAQANGRIDVCDLRIGRLLAHAPADEDGTWPCMAVRDCIEPMATDHLRRGFLLGVFNRRGVHCRTNDGQQERTIAEWFDGHARAVQITHPQTASLLAQLAEDYRRDGRREDLQGRLSEFEH